MSELFSIILFYCIDHGCKADVIQSYIYLGMSGYGPILLISEKAMKNVGKDLHIFYLF